MATLSHTNQTTATAAHGGTAVPRQSLPFLKLLTLSSRLAPDGTEAKAAPLWTSPLILGTREVEECTRQRYEVFVHDPETRVWGWCLCMGQDDVHEILQEVLCMVRYANRDDLQSAC